MQLHIAFQGLTLTLLLKVDESSAALSLCIAAGFLVWLKTAARCCSWRRMQRRSFRRSTTETARCDTTAVQRQQALQSLYRVTFWKLPCGQQKEATVWILVVPKIRPDRPGTARILDPASCKPELTLILTLFLAKCDRAGYASRTNPETMRRKGVHE